MAEEANKAGMKIITVNRHRKGATIPLKRNGIA
jgi:hypothetical protein